MTETEIQEYIAKIAEMNGVTAEQIEKEIQATIDEAFQNPNEEALAIPKNGKVPTVKEFIEHLLQILSSMGE